MRAIKQIYEMNNSFELLLLNQVEISPKTIGLLWLLILAFSIIWPEISSFSSALPRFLFLLSIWWSAQETLTFFQFTCFFIHSLPLFLPSWDLLFLLKHSQATFFITSPPPCTVSLSFSPLTPLTFSSTFMVCWVRKKDGEVFMDMCFWGGKGIFYSLGALIFP